MLTLRALEPEDLEALYQIENDTTLWSVSNTTAPYSRYALREYIATNACDIYADRQLRQVICNDNATENVIGLIDLATFEPRHQRAEVCIIIRKDYQHKGIATEAIHKIIDFATQILDLSQLYAIVPESNIASQHLFAKCGFEHTATLKNWLHTPQKQENALFFQLFLKKNA